MMTLLLVILTLLPTMALAESSTVEPSATTAPAERTAPLTIEEVLARIELTHPLLRATGLYRAEARAKVLKTLAAWEQKLRNELAYDRYQTYNLTNVVGAPNHLNAGYNDTTLKVGHP